MRNSLSPEWITIWPLPSLRKSRKMLGWCTGTDQAEKWKKTLRPCWPSRQSWSKLRWVLEFEFCGWQLWWGQRIQTLHIWAEELDTFLAVLVCVYDRTGREFQPSETGNLNREVSSIGEDSDLPLGWDGGMKVKSAEQFCSNCGAPLKWMNNFHFYFFIFFQIRVIKKFKKRFLCILNTIKCNYFVINLLLMGENNGDWLFNSGIWPLYSW